MIIVDNRERNSLVPSILEQEKVQFVYDNLEVGDYMISEVCIERKEASDYIGSLTDGRLNNQLYNMSVAFDHSIVIIEGRFADALENRQFNRTAFLSSLAGLMIKRAPDGKSGVVSIVCVETSFDTAMIIKYINEKFEEGAIRLPSVRKPNMNKDERLVMLISTLPNIGEKRARVILSKFGSIKKIAEANIDDLAEVDGIGKKTATQIVEFLNQEYTV